MFPKEAREFLTTANAWLASDRTGDSWLVWEHDGSVVGVAFFEPREATDRVWYLQMLAVAPSAQGQGVGKRLLHCVEEDLRAREQRLLLIETSGTPPYDRTRSFYTGL